MNSGKILGKSTLGSYYQIKSTAAMRQYMEAAQSHNTSSNSPKMFSGDICPKRRFYHAVESQPVLSQLQHKYHITFSSLTKIELCASAWSRSSLHLCVISWSSNVAIIFRKLRSRTEKFWASGLWTAQLLSLLRYSYIHQSPHKPNR